MPSHKLLRHATVITFDDTTQRIKILPRASILITDDLIAGIANPSSSDHALCTAHSVLDPEILDCTDHIISPGFVNTHLHAWQSAYRTVTPDIVLAAYFSWVSQHSALAPRAFTPEDVYVSALEGYLEGLNAGTTSVVEHAHCNWSEGVMRRGFEGAVDSGARVWWCFDVLTREGMGEEEQWRVLEELKGRERGTVELGLAIDGISERVVGDGGETVGLVKDMARKLGLKVITTHFLGGPWPGLPNPPTKLCACGLHTANLPIILSHASFLTDEDMAVMREHDLNASITPESECHYGHGQLTGREISDQASLGVDTAFTFSGDMMTQARLWLQVVRNTGYHETLTAKEPRLPRQTPMTVEQAFLLATRQGGRALRRDDLGVIKVGAKADLAIFGGDSPNMLGWSDPVAAVVLHANAADVRHVMVNGEWKKKDGKLVGLKLEWKEITRRFREAAARIAQAVKDTEAPVLEGKLWGQREYGDVQVSTTIRGPKM